MVQANSVAISLGTRVAQDASVVPAGKTGRGRDMGNKSDRCSPRKFGNLPFVHLLSIFCEKLHASPNTLEIPFPLVLVAANSSGLLQPEKYFVSDILTQ